MSNPAPFIDLGDGNVAPTQKTEQEGALIIKPPTIPADYAPFGHHIGDVLSTGKITGWDAMGQPVLDTSVTDPNAPSPFAAFTPSPDESKRENVPVAAPQPASAPAPAIPGAPEQPQHLAPTLPGEPLPADHVAIHVSFFARLRELPEDIWQKIKAVL